MTIVEMVQARPAKGVIEQGFEVFLRVMAIIALVSGLSYWVGITGLFGDIQMRFDQAEVPVRIVCSAMAMLMPSAALGLWLATRWGVVLWVVAAGAELLAIGFFDITLARAQMILSINAVGLVVMIVWTAAVLLERRATRLRAR